MVLLGGYRGNFWEVLCQALAPDRESPPSQSLTRALVESGALVLLLDGINEVQDSDLQRRLVTEINALTAPAAPTARSLWIVSGRVQDYEQSRLRLEYLEARRWELQPLTADLIYQYLASAFGDAQGLVLYRELGQNLREVCTRPLLLSMVFAVYQQTGRVSTGRGALYREFVGLLLRWGDERAVDSEIRAQLAGLLPEPLTDERYAALAEQALSALAAAMVTTLSEWGTAMKYVAAGLTTATAASRERVANLLLESLVRRSVLQRDTFHRVRFFHHTVQEYFQARRLIGVPASELIPAGGIPAERREAIIFLAGLLPDPAPLVERALEFDLALAFEMLHDLPRPVPQLSRRLAELLWERIRLGSVTGNQRRVARLFQRVAAQRGQSVEELAAEIDGAKSRTQQAQRLMVFYSELGDTQSQQRVLRGAMQGQDVPDDLLFRAASTACSTGDDDQAIDLYTRYLKQHPTHAVAHNNRGFSYRRKRDVDAALKDYQRAIELDGRAPFYTNLAVLLDQMKRRPEAIQQLEIALKKDPASASAHFFLANYIEADDPERALSHRDQAVRFAPHDEDLAIYLCELADLQEKLGRYAPAIRSLREMIALDPTNAQVASRKGRIATLRQRLDEEQRTRSTRERLQEQGELPVSVMAVEWLKAAGLKVVESTAIWLLASNERQPPTLLPVSLASEPLLTGALLRELIDSLPTAWRRYGEVLIVTGTDTLTTEAHHQLAALQDEYKVALVTALDIRDALLKSDIVCHQLLDQARKHTGRKADPFAHQGVVSERTEFFGRTDDLRTLADRLGQGQQVGLFGIHKIGKSSLLAHLGRRLHVGHPEITVVQVELNAALRSAEDVYNLIIRQMPSADDLPTTNLTAETFRQTLTAFHRRRQQERPGHRLLLILDEYAYLIPDHTGQGRVQDFISVLGLLKALHQEGWLLVLPCGRTAALNRQAVWGRDENPFINLLHPHFLGPMLREENDALMQSLGRRAERPLDFTPEALAAVYAETGGHPAFSRLLGSRIVSAASGEITAGHVTAAIEALLSKKDDYALLTAIYDKLDEEEQHLARQLAQQGPLPRQQLIPADAEIERRKRVRDAIDNLIDITVLVQQPDGMIAHRYGLLRRAVEREIEELGLEI